MAGRRLPHGRAQSAVRRDEHERGGDLQVVQDGHAHGLAQEAVVTRESNKWWHYSAASVASTSARRGRSCAAAAASSALHAAAREISSTKSGREYDAKGFVVGTGRCEMKGRDYWRVLTSQAAAGGEEPPRKECPPRWWGSRTL